MGLVGFRGEARGKEGLNGGVGRSFALGVGGGLWGGGREGCESCCLRIGVWEMTVDILLELPEDLAVKIVEQLPAHDLMVLPQVSKGWRAFFLDESRDDLWQATVRRKFNVRSKPKQWDKCSWGRIFMSLHGRRCHECINGPPNAAYPGYYATLTLYPDSPPYAFPLCQACFSGKPRFLNPPKKLNFSPPSPSNPHNKKKKNLQLPFSTLQFSPPVTTAEGSHFPRAISPTLAAELADEDAESLTKQLGTFNACPVYESRPKYTITLLAFKTFQKHLREQQPPSAKRKRTHAISSSSINI